MRLPSVRKGKFPQENPLRVEYAIFNAFVVGFLLVFEEEAPALIKTFLKFANFRSQGMLLAFTLVRKKA